MKFPKEHVHRTTPNMLRAKARKERNRKLRDEADAAEANRLGITVNDLRFNRFKEAQEIRAKGVYFKKVSNVKALAYSH